VLHVLPHPGGGGETYVDALERLDEYNFRRFYLAPSPSPREALSTLWRTGLSVQRLAYGSDLIHAHGEVASAIALPSIALKPSIVTPNGLHLLRRSEGLARSAAAVNLRLIVRAASQFICVSEAEREDVLSVIPTAEDRLVVIHNGVDPAPASADGERVEARSTLSVREDAVAAAWIGSLDERKDPLVAARAAIATASTGVPFTLLIAGEGPLRPQLEELEAQEPGVVRVLGFRRNVREVLAAADIFVLSSHREGFSFALLEAMASGLPVVVSDVPDNVEAAGDGGIVARQSDMHSYAEAFATLAKDAKKRSDLGERARQRVATHFTEEQMVERTGEVYAAVLGERHR
jgi:glycosyltransferase involved in cell wall biosynthesis